MAGLTDGTRLVFNRRYATGHNITGSDPWVKTHGYHHNVNNRNLPTAQIPGQQPLVAPFQGLFPDEQRPQGGVWRLTPPHLPWADMSRPFGAENTGLKPGKSPA